MNERQDQRIHAIVYSNDSREELAERIVILEDGYGSMSREHSRDLIELSDAYGEINRLKAENEKLREVIDDITEVAEVSDPALVRFIAKRMSRVEVDA